ncbi:heavy metal-binding domain-containing protein [Dyadobacter tibetensis]|uniref:heavy metal-binding domain-containing protein n=1 Tax=Dyadobacter tibetensis TaxID=1211851 RepID=UPI0004B7F0A8|nr:heavy metal-binding domain-containing protein [Dyadobacter tibetensis]
MKSLLFLACMAFLASCSNTGQQTETTDQLPTDEQQELVAAGTYSCPMSCEGDKTYAQSGTCPVCKMDLTEVAMAEPDSTAHNNQ